MSGYYLVDNLLQGYLETYEKIVIVIDYEMLSDIMMCEREGLEGRNVLLLSDVMISEYQEKYHYISSEKLRVILDLYYTYEFSDKIHLISDQENKYANIFNFVKTGVLTKEEAFEALLK